VQFTTGATAGYYKGFKVVDKGGATSSKFLNAKMSYYTAAGAAGGPPPVLSEASRARYLTLMSGMGDRVKPCSGCACVFEVVVGPNGLPTDQGALRDAISAHHVRCMLGVMKMMVSAVAGAYLVACNKMDVNCDELHGKKVPRGGIGGGGGLYF
jgi:hypothetical protein